MKIHRILLSTAFGGVLSFGALHAQQTKIVTFQMGNQTSVNTGDVIRQKVIGKAKMEFTYDYRHLTDTANISSVDKDVMILQISDGMSKFFSYRRMQIDSLIKVSTADQIMANPRQYTGGETYCIYKNYPSGKLTNTDKVSTDWFLYEEDIPVHEWRLIDSTKEISGYLCHSAECDFRGRKYIAWYSEEIPVADGPWKFGNLPGLIMEVADSKEQYQFSLIGINSHASSDITFADVQYNKTSRDKFYATKHRFETDPVGYMSMVSGVQIQVRTADGAPNTAAMQPRDLHYEYMERDLNIK